MSGGGKDVDQRFEEFRQVFRADRAKDYDWVFSRLEKFLRNLLPNFYRATTEGPAAMVHADSVLRRCEELLTDGIQAKELGDKKRFGIAMRDLNLGPSVARRCPRDAEGKRKLKGHFWSFEKLVFANEMYRLLSVSGGHGVHPITSVSKPLNERPYHYYKLLIGIRNSELVSTVKESEEVPVITPTQPTPKPPRPRPQTREEIAEDYRRFLEEESLAHDKEPPLPDPSLLDEPPSSPMLISPSPKGWSRERFLKDQIIGDLFLLRQEWPYIETLKSSPFHYGYMVDLVVRLIEEATARPSLDNPDRYCLELDNNPDRNGYPQFSNPFLIRLQQPKLILETCFLEMQDMPCKVIPRFVAWTCNPHFDWQATRGEHAQRLGQGDFVAHHRCRNTKCINPSHLMPIIWSEHRKLHQLCCDEDELPEEVEAMWPEV